ncbi:MAG: hypothetical protein AAGF11_45095 [Myxococcota bacterium]
MFNLSTLSRSSAVLALCLSASACDPAPQESTCEDSETQTPGAVDGPFERITSVSFGPDNVLFIGDATNATVTAVDVGADAGYQDAHFNLFSVDALIATHFGVPSGTLAIPDMAVHPTTAEVYVAVTQTTADSTASTVVKVTPDGTVTEVDVGSATTHTLKDAISEEITFWGRESARTYSITDMDYADGYLYVAGLTNADFASTLHKVPYPFDGSEAASTVGIYHAGHGQTETRAPIRTQTILTLGGEPYMLAAYTCTPLVLIPLGEIEDGAHITGKTIGEMGSGNTPRDIMQINGQNLMTGESQPMVLLTNEQLGGMTILLSDLEAAVDAPGLTEPLGLGGGTAGVPFSPAAMWSYSNSVAQGPGRVLHTFDNPQTGGIDLLSTHAGVFMRLSGFIGEYEFNNWTCDTPEVEAMMQGAAAIAADEGIDLSSIMTGRDCE